MGLSFGGRALIHMATMAPGRLEAIILNGCTPNITEGSRQMRISYNPDLLSEKRIERLRTLHLHGDEQIRKVHQHLYDRAFLPNVTEITPADLGTISARTLIIHGDRDASMPVEIALEMYRSIPNSFLWLSPNTGHPAFFDAGDEYMRITREFLRGEWGAERS